MACLKNTFLGVFAIVSLATVLPAQAEELAPASNLRINKLMYMYAMYYLPFSLDFEEGRTVNDIIPLVKDSSGQTSRILRTEELTQLDNEWESLRSPWRKKSLLQSTVVPIGQSVRISQHLIGHHIALSRTSFDTLSIPEQIQLQEALRGKSVDVQNSFRQLRFLKSFIKPTEEDHFNFFIISASWCDSCKEYRLLLESFLKMFPDSNLNLHSVVIEDPKKEIFESRILKELFPNPKKYTHDSIPRFLAVETTGNTTKVYEEGEAIKELYNRFFKNHRGFMNSKTTLFKNIRPTPPEEAPLPSTVDQPLVSASDVR